MALIIPENYDPHLTVRETQEAIKYIRDTFQKEFGREMNLERISAPLFVEKSSGLNDNLNGVERPVTFDVPALGANARWCIRWRSGSAWLWLSMISMWATVWSQT